jgi:tetratricopeptide (TPR) repeat protein
MSLKASPGVSLPLPGKATNDRLPRSSTILISLGLTLSTLAVYWPVIHSNFVNLDDPIYILRNPHVLSGLNWENIQAAFQVGYGANWHPLTWFSHLLDVQLFGLNPGKHHLTSLVLHCINTILLFLLLKQMTRAIWRSAFVAALFAFHPLHVESVAWISERKDVLSGFFFILTLWAYSKYVEEKGSRVEGRGLKDGHAPLSPLPPPRFYALTLLFFAMGLMSKPMLVTVPFVLLVIDYWPLGRWRREKAQSKTGKTKSESGTFWTLLLEKVPFFVVATGSCVITFLAQKRGSAVATLSNVPLQMRFENALVSYAFYLRDLFWPVSLGAYYPLPTVVPIWQVAGAVTILVVLSIVGVATLRTRPFLAVGWFWFLGMMIPVIGLVQVGLQARADRYTYLPFIGLFIALTWTVAEAAKRTPEPVLARRKGAGNDSGNLEYQGTPISTLLLAVAACAVLLACMVVARIQVGFWRDSETLYQHTLRVTTNNYFIHQNLGTLLLGEERCAEAAEHFAEAIRINPRLAEAYGAMGFALVRQGKSRQAIPFYRKALDFAPQAGPLLEQNKMSSHVHYLLGNALVTEGQREEAVAEFKTALALDPKSVGPLNDLAWLLATDPESSLRNGAQAVEFAQKACSLSQFQEPQFVGTLAAAYAEAGNFDAAIRTAEQARDLATSAGRIDLANINQQLLEFYREGKPVRGHK